MTVFSDQDTESPALCTQRLKSNLVKAHSNKAAIYKPTREAPE